jgi:hypothetical protein
MPVPAILLLFSCVLAFLAIVVVSQNWLDSWKKDSFGFQFGLDAAVGASLVQKRVDELKRPLVPGPLAADHLFNNLAEMHEFTEDETRKSMVAADMEIEPDMGDEIEEMAWEALLGDKAFMDSWIIRERNGQVLLKMRRIDHWLLHGIGPHPSGASVMRRIEKLEPLVYNETGTLWEAICRYNTRYLERVIRDVVPSDPGFYAGDFFLRHAGSLETWTWWQAVDNLYCYADLEGVHAPAPLCRTLERLSDPGLIAIGERFTDNHRLLSSLITLWVRPRPPQTWWNAKGLVFKDRRGRQGLWLSLANLMAVAPKDFAQSQEVLDVCSRFHSLHEIVDAIEHPDSALSI